MSAKASYTLQSAGFVYAPGVVAWAINGYHFKNNRKAMLRVIIDGWPGVKPEAAKALLSGAIAYRIENDSVCFEA